MKQKTYTVYKFHELPDDVQEKVIENWRNDDYFFWSNEWRETLDEFCALFGIKVNNWSIDFSRAYISKPQISIEHPDVLDFTGLRLYKWVVNNLRPYIYRPKFIGYINHHTSHKRTRNKTAKTTGTKSSNYYSSVLTVCDCPLTGYCGDHAILQPLVDYFKTPPKNGDSLDQLIYDCLQSWAYAYQKDLENWFSAGCIRNEIAMNDYDFDENGNID